MISFVEIRHDVTAAAINDADSLQCDASVLLDDHQYVIQNFENKSGGGSGDHEYANLAPVSCDNNNQHTCACDEIQPSAAQSKKAFVKRKKLLVDSSSAKSLLLQLTRPDFPSRCTGDSLLKTKQQQEPSPITVNSTAINARNTVGAVVAKHRPQLKLVLPTPADVTRVTSTSREVLSPILNTSDVLSASFRRQLSADESVTDANTAKG